MGSLFKRSKTPGLGSDRSVSLAFPDPSRVPPEYLALFQLAADDELEALKAHLEKLPPAAIQVTIGPQNLLHSASQNGGARVVQYLVEQGLRVNEGTSGSGVTPLMYAVRGGHSQIAGFLLDSGADANTPIAANDPKYAGMTALHWAVATENSTMVKLLLNKGAQPQVRDRAGRCALDLAQQMQATEMTALLSGQATTNADTSDPQQLANLASDAATVEMGLELAQKITRLPGFSNSEDQQIYYCIALINLTAKAANAQQAATLLEQLQQYQSFSQRGPQANWVNACRHAASKARPAELGLGLAELLPQLSFFGQDLEFREAYSNTLFNVSVNANSGAFCGQLAEKIMALDGFSESGDMHFDCGRILCNASGKADNEAEARQYAAHIQTLPLYARMPQLQEAATRALRNCERFR